MAMEKTEEDLQETGSWVPIILVHSDILWLREGQSVSQSVQSGHRAQASPHVTLSATARTINVAYSYLVAPSCPLRCRFSFLSQRRLD